MDKITRIHLAKVPYEISISAQEKLQKYFNEIRNELGANLADEVMKDIEVRITEILSDRNVEQNGVITLDDISAIEKQLGSPGQFTEDDKQNDDAGSRKEPRKLLRNLDNAYIGGVASGIGAYFGIDPIFIRLIFVALIFASGLGVVLYILSWVLLPAAISSSDKLQMSGQPVTAVTLERYRTSMHRRFGNSPSIVQKFILRCVQIIISAFSVWVCLCLLGFLGVISSSTFVYPFRTIFKSYGLDYLVLALTWVIGISIIGLLVILIIRIWGHHSSRMKVSSLAFLATLVIALAGIVATGELVYNHFSNEYGNNKTARALLVNNKSPNISPAKLQVNSNSNLNINYVVSARPIHASYSAYPGLIQPQISITNKDGVLSVNSGDLSQAAPNCLGNLCKHIYLPIRVTLYGPSVSSIADNNGATLWINNNNFGKSISITAVNYSSVTLDNGYAVDMNLYAYNDSTIMASNSSAQQTSVATDLTSSVFAPTTNNLYATLPSNCDQVEGSPLLNLNQYSGVVKINGQIQSTNNLDQSNCINTN